MDDNKKETTTSKRPLDSDSESSSSSSDSDHRSKKSKLDYVVSTIVAHCVNKRLDKNPLTPVIGDAVAKIPDQQALARQVTNSVERAVDNQLILRTLEETIRNEVRAATEPMKITLAAISTGLQDVHDQVKLIRIGTRRLKENWQNIVTKSNSVLAALNQTNTEMQQIRERIEATRCRCRRRVSSSSSSSNNANEGRPVGNGA
ncbi:uncharacterized protein LOC135835020 [Planococcus citri]|uniref:uncharacterized protein LOC135835020 n=1 Tax=Planococcus citri TaxID=170843 RepID=UPI0031F8FA9E